MRTLFFLLFSTCLAFSQGPPLFFKNSWTTNINTNTFVYPVVGDNNLAISNRIAGLGGGTNWNFYGIGPSTVARLTDITNAGNGNWVAKVNGSVTNLTNSGTTGLGGNVLLGAGTILTINDLATDTHLLETDFSGAVVHSTYSDSDISALALVSSGLLVSTPALGWSNRVSIPISLLNCGPTTNQRTLITLSGSKVVWSQVQTNNSAADFRLYDSDGFTPLTFYVKSVTSNSATIGVSLTNLPGTGTKTLYLDYGNSAALSTQSTTNTLQRLPVIANNGTAARWLVNEGSGSVVSDSSGNGWHMTNVGTATWKNSSGYGPNGTNIGFSDPYLTLASNAYLRASNDVSMPNLGVTAFTVRMWVRLVSKDSSGFQWLFMKAPNNSVYFSLHTQAGILKMQSDAVTLSSGVNLTTNHWYHIVGVNAYNGMKIYVDGVLCGQTVANSIIYPPTTLTSSHAVTINADNRNGTPVANTISIDVGEVQVDYRRWEIDDVLSDYNFLGRPIPINPRQKLLCSGLFTNQSPTLGFVPGEVSRFHSSYDNRWKMVWIPSGTTNIHLGESDNPSDSYIDYGLVTNTGPHGFATDDGNGSCYFFWLSASNLFYRISTNGGHSWSEKSSNSIAAQFKGVSSSANPEGNVSITPFFDGPLSGKFGLLAELKDTSNSRFQLWVGLATNITGPYTLVNGSNSLSTLDFVTTVGVGSPTSAKWINGRYRVICQGEINTSPSCLASISTLDWANWVMDNPIFLDLADQNYALDQIGDPDIVYSGGICSLVYVALSNQQADTNYPARGPGQSMLATFNGTAEQLFSIGSYNGVVDFSRGYNLTPDGGLYSSDITSGNVTGTNIISVGNALVASNLNIGGIMFLNGTNSTTPASGPTIMGCTLQTDGTNLFGIFQNAGGTKLTNKFSMTAWP